MEKEVGTASEAMLKTLSTLTGYDADQLPVFFRSLCQMSVNPLQMADSLANTTTEGRRLDAVSDIDPRINDATARVVPGEDFSEKEVAKGEIVPQIDSSEVNEAKEKLASGVDTAEENDTKERLVSSHDSLEETGANEKVASEDESSKEDDEKKLDSDDGPEKTAEAKKI